MSFTPIDSGATEVLWFTARDSAGAALTGVTDLRVAIVRSDGLYLDWSDNTFKASGSVVTLRQAFTEVSASMLPGVYSVTTPVLGDGKYLAYVDQSPGTSVSGLPATSELRVGQAPTAAAVTALPTAVQALILSDATPFAGGRIDAAISSRATNAGVWATAEGTPAVGTMAYSQVLLRKWITNRTEVDTTSSGRERLFDDDGTTVLYTWTLRDGAGAAISTPTGSPARRGAAT